MYEFLMLAILEKKRHICFLSMEVTLEPNQPIHGQACCNVFNDPWINQKPHRVNHAIV